MADATPTETHSRFAKFIQNYSGFLSSFVIGAAGLIATSIWQYRQSEIAQHQAAAQQKVAETQAANSWKIERAEILSKNLQVLASQGSTTVDQRYGVLLSLTRGNILDPELAVSYALELGKDNPDYMRSVLSNTADKNYLQLTHAFQLTCLQRFGVAKDVAICKTDKFGDRSQAIADEVSDELDAAQATGKPGPMSLLKDDRQVLISPLTLAWLFEPYLQNLYERRLWNEITRFEHFSTGAQLVAALDLATARTGEFVTADESARLDQFHAERRKWLISYLFGASCDGECKGKLVDVMLSVYGDAQGDYNEAMRKLLGQPRNETGPAVSRLHQRLLWCEVDDDDLVEFRDQVLTPTLGDLLNAPKLDGGAIDDLAGLLAIVPDPKDPKALADWKDALKKLVKAGGDHYQKSFVKRRATAKQERLDPPYAMKKVSFCNAADLTDAAPKLDE